MQTLESLAPLPGPAPEPKSDWPDPDSSRSSAEQFDSIMGRTLAHAQSGTDPETPDSNPLRAKSRSGKTATPDLNSPAAADALGAMYGPTPPPPPADGISLPPNSGSDANNATSALPATGKARTGHSGSPTDATETSPTQRGDAAGSKAQTTETNSADGTKAGKTTSSLESDASEDQGSDANTEDTQGASQLIKSLTTTLPEKLIQAESAAGSVDPPAKISLGGVSRANAVDPADLGGISSAQQHLAMQKADKTKESAAPAQQNLPTSPANGAGEDLPARAAARAESLSSRPIQSTAPATSPNSLSSTAPAPQTATATPAPSNPWPSADPLRSLERTHDLMSLHAFRLRDSGADSLQVMIKPGTGLQISLQLQMRDGAVEMKATLHRGDYEFLSRNWQQLQQQLEPRGVRLAPLLSGNPTTTGSQHSFQPPGGRPEDQDSETVGALTGLALAGALKPAVAKMKTMRGWETWA